MYTAVELGCVTHEPIDLVRGMAMLSTAMDGYQVAGWITGGMLLLALALALAMSAHYRYLARRDRDIDRLAAIFS